MMIRMMLPLGLESWPPNHSESLPITTARDGAPIGLEERAGRQNHVTAHRLKTHSITNPAKETTFFLLLRRSSSSENEVEVRHQPPFLLPSIFDINFRDEQAALLLMNTR